MTPLPLGSHRAGVSAALAASSLFVSLLAAQDGTVRPLPAAAAAPSAPQASGPLQFVENRGQWPAEVAFRTRRGPMAAWFGARGWTLHLRRLSDDRASGVAVRLTFENGDGSAPRGERAATSTASYFRGQRAENWITGVRSFASIRYAALYRGIDVVVRSGGASPEYDVHVAPGADPSDVVMRCEGVDGLRLDADGSLLMDTAHGPIRQRPPTTWQVRADGSRQPVTCGFRLLDSERYGFAVEGLDGDLPLVIDPGFEWSTYYGGSADDRLFIVRPNGRGQVFVTGLTNSIDLPTTPGAFLEQNAGDWDAFVALFDPSKTGADQLVSATYLGGSGLEEGYELRVDQSGFGVTVSGYTESRDFPTTHDAWQPAFAGGLSDGFYAKLDFHGRGSRLVYATYVGGPGDDWVNGHVDDRAIATIAGQTQDGFPVTSGALQTTYGGGDWDIYVLRLDTRLPRARQLQWSTYLGGDGADGDRFDFTDRGLNVELDDRGGPLLSGRTASTDFPTSPHAFQTALRGTTDAFVARLSPDGRRLIYSTYFGGDGDEDFNQVLWDGYGGQVSAGGYTTGPGFPTTADAFQPSYAGGAADFVLVRLDTWKLGAAQLVYATHVGGNDGPVTTTERLRGLAVEPSGAFLFGGWGGASDFPVTAGAFKTTLQPPFEAILGRLDPQQAPADQLLYATYIGGSAGEACLHVTEDGAGGIYCGGITTSPDFTTTPGAFQTTAAARDGWVAQFDLLPAGVTKLGHSTPACNGTIYAGVTTQPRGGRPTIGLFNNNAPPHAFGVMLLGAPATPSLQLLNVQVFVDWRQPLVARGVLSNHRGYAQVDMDQSSLPASPAAFQFVWMNPPHCTRGRLSASNALQF